MVGVWRLMPENDSQAILFVVVGESSLYLSVTAVVLFQELMVQPT